MAKQHSPRFLKISEEARAKVHEVDNAAVKKRLDAKDPKLKVIDVREDHEWQKGHVPGAVHLGRGILERDIEKLVPNVDDELVLYCGGGFRSALAAESLQRMGYKNVHSMAGGWTGWTERGFPTETKS